MKLVPERMIDELNSIDRLGRSMHGDRYVTVGNQPLRTRRYWLNFVRQMARESLALEQQYGDD